MNTIWRHNTVNITPRSQNDWFCSQRRASSLDPTKMWQARTTPGMTRRNKKVTDSSHSRLCQVPTWPTTTWWAPPEMRTSQKYIAPLAARDAFQLMCSVQLIRSASDTSRQRISRERASCTRDSSSGQQNTTCTFGGSHGRILGHIWNRTRGCLVRPTERKTTHPRREGGGEKREGV